MQDPSNNGFLEMTPSWMLDADFLLFSAALVTMVCGLHFNESAREARGRGGFPAALPWLALFSWCVAANFLLHAVALNLASRMAWYAGLEVALKLASLVALAIGIVRTRIQPPGRLGITGLAIAAIGCMALALHWPIIGIVLAGITAATVTWHSRNSHDACWAPALWLLVPLAASPWLLAIYRDPILSQRWMQERWSGESFLWLSLAIAMIALLGLFGILAATYCADRQAGESRRSALASALAVLAVISLALGGTWWLGDGFAREHNLEETGELIARVTTAAMVIDPEKTADLNVGDAFEETQQLSETRHILRQLLDTNPDLAVAYLWIIEDGRLYFLAIEDRGGFSSGLAGTSFRKALPNDVEAYQRDFPFVFGPFRDDWGVYIAANARIADPHDGGRVVWLGMDFKIEMFLQRRAASRLNAKGLGLIACGALSIAGIFRRRSRREERLHMAIEHAADEERARLAMEIHDGLGQKLTAITLLGQATQSVNSPADTAASPTRRMAALASEIRRDLLLTIRGLGPVELSQGLQAALRSLIEPLAETGVTLTLDLRGNPDHLPRRVQADLFRIAQEATSNSLRHGKAREIHVTLTLRDHEGSLLIEDDGTAASTSSLPGWGLRTMARRAHRIGGALSHGPRPSGGFRVLCSFPV